MKVGTPGIVTVIEGPCPPEATAPPRRDPNNCSRFPTEGASCGGLGADPCWGVPVLLDCVGPDALVLVGVLVDEEEVKVCEDDVVVWLAVDIKENEMTWYELAKLFHAKGFCTLE